MDLSVYCIYNDWFKYMCSICRKYTADVQRRDIARQQDSQEKLDRTRAAKRIVSFNIAEKEQNREDREAEREHARLQRLKASTQRRRDIEAQREKEIQDTIARRRVSVRRGKGSSCPLCMKQMCFQQLL